MEYRKLNFIDGPETDLHTFMQMLIRAFERKEAGSAARINFDIISKAAAMGIITGFMAFENGTAVGVQVWEHLDAWFDNSVKHNFCRVVFIEPALASPQNLAMFMQAGIKSTKDSVGGKVILATQETDQLHPHASNMGFGTFGHSWSPDV